MSNQLEITVLMLYLKLWITQYTHAYFVHCCYFTFVSFLYIVSTLNNMQEQMYFEGMYVPDAFLAMGIKGYVH